MKDSTHSLLVSQGYKFIDDAWSEHGRRTYLHVEDATRLYVADLARTLRSKGWEIDRTKLRSFRHSTTDEIIELEPGGSETTGHFLHHMEGSK